MVPTVCRVKFNSLRLAFSSFQNLTPAHFQSDCLQMFVFHLKYLWPAFPACCTHFCLLVSVPLVSPFMSTASLISFIKPTVVSHHFIGFFSNTFLECYLVFFYILSSYPTQWQAIWDQGSYLPDSTYFLGAPSLL